MHGSVRIYQHPIRCLALGTVAGEGVAVIKVRMYCRIEFDLSPILKAQRDATVGRDLLDASQFTVSNAELLLGAVN
jgi:hypothetical protein